MEKKGLGGGLEEISNIFLSVGEKAKEVSHPSENQCEIEETVAVRKKLAFYNDDNVQQNIQRSLAEHLELGFHISRIYLQKHEATSSPGSKTHRKEDVIISIKPLS